jgi:hypothetical protein
MLEVTFTGPLNAAQFRYSVYNSASSGKPAFTAFAAKPSPSHNFSTKATTF